MRRLSSQQFANVISDLFGDDVGRELLARSTFPATQIASGFSTFATANPVNFRGASEIADTAESFSEYIVANPEQSFQRISDCDAQASDLDEEIDGCIGGLIERFGARAYRRPLVSEEVETLNSLYSSVRDLQGPRAGLRTVLEAIFQSPQFLYIIETGEEEVDGASGLVKLSDYEMASRLSFLFLNSMPDEELLAAAEAGELSTKQQITAQARRLAGTARATEVLGDFHNDWVQVYKLAAEPRDLEEYPNATAEVAEALQHEVAYFTEHVLADYGNFEGLLTSNTLVVPQALETVYGQTAGAEPVDFGSERMGLLTLASVTAAHSHSDASSPILRGAFIRRQILCGETGTFPGDLDTVGPLAGAAHLPTARERLAPLLENDQCRGCHVTMNPIGLAFENYDGLGQFRTEENGSPIDTSGRLEFADDADGDFANHIELIKNISQSTTAQECYSRQWFSYATAHAPVESDRCDVDNLSKVFLESGGDLGELMVAVTTTNAFRFLVRAE